MHALNEYKGAPRLTEDRSAYIAECQRNVEQGNLRVQQATADVARANEAYSRRYKTLKDAEVRDK